MKYYVFLESETTLPRFSFGLDKVATTITYKSGWNILDHEPIRQLMYSCIHMLLLTDSEIIIKKSRSSELRTMSPRQIYKIEDLKKENLAMLLTSPDRIERLLGDMIANNKI